jgi:fatty-acyl-CoA synthase
MRYARILSTGRYVPARVVNERGADLGPDAGGWLHTGDIIRQDAEGFLSSVGRGKYVFISRGANAYRVELENTLTSHEAVAQAAVVGIPDSRWGEVGCAFVFVEAGRTATADGLLEHIRGRVARYEVPKYLSVLPAMPLSATGKTLESRLREQAILEVQR